MEAMLFNSTRKYYCCNLQNGSAEWIFDGQQLKKDLKELQVIYPETLTSFIGHLIEESPKERDSISTAKNLLQDIRA